MRFLYRSIVAILPFLIVAGLLYAGLFVKPVVHDEVRPPAVIGSRDAFYGVCVPAPNVYWAVGRGGKIVRSDDAGQHWVAQPVKEAEGVALQAIAAWDVHHAVVVGDHGMILQTADGGLHWHKVPFDDGDHKLLNVRAGTDGQGWAVGEFDTVLQTDDYGTHWKNIGGKKDVAWNDIAQPAEGRLITVGEFGRIRRSDDNGKAWIDVTTPVKSSLLGVAFRGKETGVAVGLDGVVLATADGGASWSVRSSGTQEHLFAVAATQDGWVAVGDHGVMARSGPTDIRWRAERIAPHDYAWLTTVAPTGTSLLLGGQILALWHDGKLESFK